MHPVYSLLGKPASEIPDTVVKTMDYLTRMSGYPKTRDQATLAA